METSVKRVLFVNSEMTPYLGESQIACATRTLTQGIQERKIEIRSFMPRYGLINERKNQLHEVIRLSGMNIVVDDVDRPLIIKVASLPSSRMQVYFIDNDDFFRRKALYAGEDGKFFKDNGERAVFFARGVLETVKKLRWSPDIIHCSGWISHVLPLYLKKCYKEDPIFEGSKIVLSLYSDTPKESFGASFADAVLFQGASREDVSVLEGEPDGIKLAELAINHSEGVIAAAKDVPQQLLDYARKRGVKILDYDSACENDPGYVGNYKQFYEQL